MELKEIIYESKKIVQLPARIFFVELPEDFDSMEYDFPSDFAMSDQVWRLKGRIVATAADGQHYFCQVYRDDRMIQGWYVYNDLGQKGRAIYTGKVPNKQSYSWFAAYVLE
jgi:hypothetical protein